MPLQQAPPLKSVLNLRSQTSAVGGTLTSNQNENSG
jgi:hypothetical protein